VCHKPLDSIFEAVIRIWNRWGVAKTITRIIIVLIGNPGFGKIVGESSVEFDMGQLEIFIQKLEKLDPRWKLWQIVVCCEHDTRKCERHIRQLGGPECG
jgi:hypothetical protein